MEILTRQQVAEMLQLKPEAIYNLTRERARARQKHPIPYIRIAGKVRFQKSAIENWIATLSEEQ